MRNSLFAFLAFSLVASMALQATGQPPDGPGAGRPPGAEPGGLGPAGGGPGFAAWGPLGADKLMLLGRKSIRDELDLSDKQHKQIQLRIDKQRKAMEALRELEPEEVEKRIAKQSKTNDALLAKLLTADQFKRLSQISYQRQGPRALATPEAAKTLALTGAQKSKLQQIQDESRSEMREAVAELRGPGGPGTGPGGPGGRVFGRQLPAGQFPGGQFPGGKGPPGPGARVAGQGPPGAGPPGPAGPGALAPEQQEAMKKGFEKIGELRKAADEKMLGVLTSQQRTKWESMQGEPFEDREDPGGFGPPGTSPPNRPGAPPDRAGPPEGAVPPDRPAKRSR